MIERCIADPARGEPSTDGAALVEDDYVVGHAGRQQLGAVPDSEQRLASGRPGTVVRRSGVVALMNLLAWARVGGPSSDFLHLLGRLQGSAAWKHGRRDNNRRA